VQKIAELLYQKTTLTVVVAASAIFIFFMVAVLPPMANRLIEITGVSVSPDTSFIYNATDLYAMAEAYGDQGRAYYIYSRFTFDLAWPIAYLFFLTSGISYLFKINGWVSRLRLINLLPLLAFLFDLFENTGASLVMFRYPVPTRVIAGLVPLFTFTKWIFVGLSFTALVAGLILLLAKKRPSDPVFP